MEQLVKFKVFATLGRAYMVSSHGNQLTDLQHFEQRFKGCCFDTGAIGKSMSYPGRGRDPAEFFCLSICNKKGAGF